jgi:uncharacterized membrane protein YGL010W
LAHIPIAAFTLLTATAYASQPGSLWAAATVHVLCWLAQFYGHGVHEGRAPALLDNLLGGRFLFLWWLKWDTTVPPRTALVLAPLFVHYEALFMLGFLKQTKKDLQNDVGKLNTELRLKKKEVKKE